MNPTPSQLEVSTESASVSVTAVMAHVSDSDASVLAGGDCFNSQEHLVLAAEEEELLQVKKKQLLDELESALVTPKDTVKLPLPPIAMPNPVPVRPSLGLGIEVIDETALLETVPRKITTAASKNARRRAPGKGGEGGPVKKQIRHHKKTVTAEEIPVLRNSEAKGGKYTRKDMMALRFVNVAGQRRFWKTIYANLESGVAQEYDTLAVNVHHLPCLPNKKPILGKDFLLRTPAFLIRCFSFLLFDFWVLQYLCIKLSFD